MNEATAREVVMVRAVETMDAQRALWSDEDRDWASRAAAEVVGTGAAPEAFVARRASLALERLGTRAAAIPRALRAVTWRSWIGYAIVAAAFAVGLAVDRIGPRERVNILAFPLLGLIVWNVAVYALILIRGLAGIASDRARGLGPIARAVARFAHGAPRRFGVGEKEESTTSALADFAESWGRLSAPLLAARVGTILHAAAFALALGALAGLYLRGLVFEYRAVWGSTFLDAPEVRTVLSFFLGPASALTGIPIADVARLEAIRLAPDHPGENAAPWIHLYAATIALVVLVPRAAALFSLAATPEAENHGTFLDRLTAKARGAPVAAILDEAGFRKRFAGQPARLEERRNAWRDVLAPFGIDPVFVDLESPDLVAAEASFNAAMESAARRKPRS
ncbi:MAG: hypothetical protein H6Q91_3471 [Deltaproteobacteria bacterium]|nr:hypothetical protein [Deltaproteobacteria bacterium]